MKFFQIANRQEGECPYQGYFLSFFRCYNNPLVRDGWMFVINLPISFGKYYVDPLDFVEKFGLCRPIISIRCRRVRGHLLPGLYNWSCWAPQL